MSATEEAVVTLSTFGEGRKTSILSRPNLTVADLLGEHGVETQGRRIAVLTSGGDAAGMKRALGEIPWILLPVACGLSFLNYLIRFARWERYRALLGIELGRWDSFLVFLSGLAGRELAVAGQFQVGSHELALIDQRAGTREMITPTLDHYRDLLRKLCAEQPAAVPA